MISHPLRLLGTIAFLFAATLAASAQLTGERNTPKFPNSFGGNDSSHNPFSPPATNIFTKNFNSHSYLPTNNFDWTPVDPPSTKNSEHFDFSTGPNNSEGPVSFGSACSPEVPESGAFGLIGALGLTVLILFRGLRKTKN